jgi:hypothetical protein
VNLFVVPATLVQAHYPSTVLVSKSVAPCVMFDTPIGMNSVLAMSPLLRFLLCSFNSAASSAGLFACPHEIIGMIGVGPFHGMVTDAALAAELDCMRDFILESYTLEDRVVSFDLAATTSSESHGCRR